MKNSPRYFSINNVKKHFTKTNITVGIFGLTVGCLFKFTGLSAGILNFLNLDPSLLNQSILSGFTVLVTRLGIKGIVEAIFEDLSIPLAMKISSLLNPTTPPSNSGGSGGGGGSPSPNQNPGGSNPVQPQQNVDLINPEQRWSALNHDGDGFTVRNGGITVDNPGNIISFWDINGLPNRSAEAKIYANNIHRALQYHSDFKGGKKAQQFPSIDNSSREWIIGFFRHHYADRNPSCYLNSNPVRKNIQNFSRS